MAIGVALFIALMLLMWFGLRWLSRKGFGGGRSRHMEVLDRLVISRDSCILLVKIAGRVFAVAVGRDSSGLLCELSESELGASGGGRPGGASPGSGSPRAGAGFWKRFSHNMRLNMGLLPKGTGPMTPEVDEPSANETAGAFKDVLERIQQAQAEQQNPSHPPESGRKASGLYYVGTPEQDAQAYGKVADYNAAIESMRNLGLVDKEAAPRRATASVSAQARREPPVAAPPITAQTKPAEEELKSKAAVAAAYAQAAKAPDAPREKADAGGGQETDKYDMMFDLISRRQAKYSAKKDRGKEAP